MTYMLDEHGRRGARSRQDPWRHTGLLLLGLVGGFMWSTALELAGPGSWDPHEACDVRFHQSTHHIVTHYFPTRVICVGSRGSFAFMSSETTIVLTAIAALVGLVIALGLKRYGGSLFAGGAARDLPAVPDDSTRLSSAGVAKRLATHALLAALVGVGAATFGPVMLVMCGMFGDYAGCGFASTALLVVIALFMSLLDGALGPIAGGAVGSQRRGLAVATLGLAPVVYGELRFTSGFETFTWQLPIAAGLFCAVLTLLTWAPSLQRRRQLRRARSA